MPAFADQMRRCGGGRHAGAIVDRPCPDLAVGWRDDNHLVRCAAAGISPDTFQALVSGWTVERSDVQITGPRSAMCMTRSASGTPSAPARYGSLPLGHIAGVRRGRCSSRSIARDRQWRHGARADAPLMRAGTALYPAPFWVRTIVIDRHDLADEGADRLGEHVAPFC